jgi:drug/metabolite transporter (DMT)-like permease
MGEIFALMAAMIWAGAVILFKKSGETMSPFALNLFRATVSLLVFLPLLTVTGQGLFRQAPVSDYLILTLSGILGIALSDTFFHRALNTMGAGLTAIVDTLYSPFIVFFAFLILGERIGVQQFAGMLLVVGAVLLASRTRRPEGMSRRTLWLGMFWGMMAMATVGLSIVIAKPVLERHPVIWSTAMRQAASVLVMLPLALISPKRRAILAVFRPTRAWRYSLPGTLLGSCLALLFWIGGMKFAKASTAAILNQTSTIYVLILATVFLHEPFTRRKLMAAVMALIGILVVTTA